MKLFSRSVLMSGSPVETMTVASEMRQVVSDTIGREVALWSVGFGAPLGTVVYTTTVSGLADLNQIGQTLFGSADFLAMLDKNRDLTAAPPTDTLATPIHGAFGDARPPVGSVAVLTTAVVANGAYADAIGWGIDIATHVDRIGGINTLFLVDDYGPFGQVRWISIAADAAASDAASEAINADAEYLDRLKAAGTLFVPGSGQRSVVTRVA